MRKYANKLVLFIMGVFWVGSMVQASPVPFEEVVVRLAQGAGLTKGQKIRVTADNITYGSSKMGTEFSVYLEHLLAEQISESGYFEEISRQDLDRVLEELKLSQSDIFQQGTTVEPGKLKGLQAIISGEYLLTEENVIVQLRLVSLKTSKTIARSQAALPKASLPAGLEFKPVNYSVMQANTVDLPQEGELRVDVWTQRGSGAVYTEGEKLKIYFKANKDTYLRLYHVDVKGVKQMIFPNRFFPENLRLQGGVVYSFPTEQMKFEFVLGGPFGTEMIQAVASTEPFSSSQEAFQEVRGQARSVFALGLEVRRKGAEVAVSRVYYTILQKKQ